MFVVIPDYPGGSWVAFALWFVLCSSDGIDGYLARRHGATRSGAFLDPLADKVLVLGAMFTLVSRDVYWVVPVLVIAIREVAISMYRVLAGAKGISVPASRLAKFKTVAQQLSVGFAIIPLTADDGTWLWLWLLWIAVFLTTTSGLQYMAGPASQAGRAESGRLRCAVPSSPWEPNFFLGKSLTLILHGLASA
jgi:CDP-diacylglycerol---glycerol-3-phosphate 3-phosphatidyltransferase